MPEGFLGNRVSGNLTTEVPRVSNMKEVLALMKKNVVRPLRRKKTRGKVIDVALKGIKRGGGLRRTERQGRRTARRMIKGKGFLAAR